MDIQHKLTKLFLIMDSKLLLIILVILSFSACMEKADDAVNTVIINNATEDTLRLQITKKYISDIGEEHLLFPNNPYSLSVSLHTSGFGIINENWGNARDTIEIYKNDSLLVKWGGPLRDLPDSIHSFYNKNSWVITNGGRKDKYVIATFTITEDDFKKDE